MRKGKVMQNDMYRVMRLVHDFLKDERQKQQMKLPSEAYFLNEDEIVCFQRKRGDSRYPYTFDGLTLWAYSSGNVKIQESAFNILLGWENSLEPGLAFFFGIKRGGELSSRFRYRSSRVFRQVEFCSRAKNYAGGSDRFPRYFSAIGVRALLDPRSVPQQDDRGARIYR